MGYEGGGGGKNLALAFKGGVSCFVKMQTTYQNAKNQRS